MDLMAYFLFAPVFQVIGWDEAAFVVQMAKSGRLAA
jgi:hypothetical protein